MSAVAASRGKFARPGPQARLPARPVQLRLSFRRQPLRPLPAQLRRAARRAGGSKARSSTSKLRGERRLRRSGDACRRPADRRRAVHRLLGLPRPADRAGARRPVTRTGPLAAVRPRDRRAVRATPDRPIPFTRVDRASTAGWQWRIPLQHRMGNGHVYSSALHRRRRSRAGPARRTSRASRSPSRARCAFTTGPAQAALEPQRRRARPVERLRRAAGIDQHPPDPGRHRAAAQLFPDKRFNPLERDEYNRRMQSMFEWIRDFIILHYKATQRDDSEFWNYCRTMDIPDELAEQDRAVPQQGPRVRRGARAVHDAELGRGDARPAHRARRI